MSIQKAPARWRKIMLPKLENILLSTDGSLYSEGAIREAMHFAKECTAKLTVLFAMETNPEFETIGAQYFDREVAEASEHLSTIKKQSLQAGVRCETYIFQGDKASTVIVGEAVARKADMIITGRRGRSGLAKLLIGETAVELISNAPCKVLVVPKAAKIECRTILVATNGSEHSNAAMVEAIGLARCQESRILALSAMRVPDELEKSKSYVQQVVDLAHEEGLWAEGLTPLGKAVDEILETAAGRAADLIVMGVPGTKGVAGLFRGSPAEKVIANAGCAVLVVRAKKEASTLGQPGEKCHKAHQLVIA